MKITIKTLGIALIAIATLFTMAACSDDGGGDYNPKPTDGRLTITGLEEYNGKYIYGVGGFNIEKNLMAYGDLTKNGQTFSQISGGTVTLKVWEIDSVMNVSINDYYSYKGNDKNVSFQFWILENQNTAKQDPIKIGFTNADFTNGIGSGVFRLDQYPPADISNDIDNSLIGTWYEKNTGASLFTLTIAANGITWGGSSGSAVQTATQTLRDQGYTVVWTAKNGKITYIYATAGSSQQSVDVYNYEINNNGEMELKTQGITVMTLVKQ